MKAPGVAVLGLLALIAAQRPAWAFLPVDCYQSENDLASADAVVTGRVTKVERVTTKRPYGKETMLQFCYIATVTIGRVLRGDVKRDSDVSIYIGDYVQRAEDNAVPGWFSTCNTHGALPLQINNVYLLCLCRGEGHAPQELPKSWRRKLWHPNHCHYSTHQLDWMDLGEGTSDRAIGVLESQGSGKPGRPPVPLAEFLKQKMGSSEPEKAEK